MAARFGGNTYPDTGIDGDLRQPAHSDFARQTCNKPAANRQENEMACLAAQRVLPLSCLPMTGPAGR
jgi:hypothetical protein